MHFLQPNNCSWIHNFIFFMRLTFSAFKIELFEDKKKHNWYRTAFFHSACTQWVWIYLAFYCVSSIIQRPFPFYLLSIWKLSTEIILDGVLFFLLLFPQWYFVSSYFYFQPHIDFIWVPQSLSLSCVRILLRNFL